MIKENQDVSLELVSKIVTAYVSNHTIPTSELPGLIRSVHDALPHTEKTPVQFRKPAVPIRRSVKPNYIVCLEDGKKQKTLKRHLRTAHGAMTAPERGAVADQTPPTTKNRTIAKSPRVSGPLNSRPSGIS